MSNVYAGERTVPTLLLIVFIVGILVCGVMAYVIYTEKARMENELASGKEKLAKRQAGLAENLRKRDELFKAVGVSTVRQVEDIFKSSLVKLPEPEANKKPQLATLVSEQVKKRNELINRRLAFRRAVAAVVRFDDRSCSSAKWPSELSPAPGSRPTDDCPCWRAGAPRPGFVRHRADRFRAGAQGHVLAGAARAAPGSACLRPPHA